MPSKADTAVARTIGIDTGKNTLHMIGLDEKGAIVLREKVSRTRIATRLANVPPCLIGIEAGMASHHVARELVALGHEVKQVPPAYSKPFRQGHKNDFRDAHAVAEAAGRPSTRCVPIKTDGQLDHGETAETGAIARSSFPQTARYRQTSPPPPAPPRGTTTTLREADTSLCRLGAGPANH